MAKEVDLKKIELNVSANCCEGCKRKVKKALRNIEGVLETDIDPMQPKLTVLGNVNPQILIRKLQKVGKKAKLSSYEEVKTEMKETTVEKKEETIAVAKEKEKQDHGNKQVDGYDIKIAKSEKTKDVTDGESKDSKKDSKDSNITANASNPLEMKKENPYLAHEEVNFTVHPSMQPYSNIKTHPQQYSYIAQPCAVAVPYYAIPSYPFPLQYPGYVEEHYYHIEKPRFEPPFLRPTVRAGDYFSDENTMGCHVM